MHRPGVVSSELGFLPSLYPMPALGHSSDMGTATRVSTGPADTRHARGTSMQNSSWERRCLRKHKRESDDEASSVKRRRLIGEGPYMPWGNPIPEPLQVLPEPAPLYPASTPVPLSTLSSSEAEDSCMEVEAAQRRLQEIEDRITLEDDDDEEDLDVEPAQNRPVLVMSDSLKEGLQQGLGDILPPTVAQSVSRSCMELVLWRPPEETLPRKLKESLQKQRKQAACRHTPTPIPVALSLEPTPPDRDPTAVLYCSPRGSGPAHEDMEL